MIVGYRAATKLQLFRDTTPLLFHCKKNLIDFNKLCTSSREFFMDQYLTRILEYNFARNI